MNLPATVSRVPQHTAERINTEIRQRTEESVRHHASHPDQIDRRLDELDREWDIERALEANAATLGLVGVLLGGTLDRRFLLLPAAVTGFLLQHALQGWCPPVPVFRRLGFRSEAEIAKERSALKALRGDFADVAANVGPAERAGRALAAARR